MKCGCSGDPCALHMQLVAARTSSLLACTSSSLQDPWVMGQYYYYQYYLWASTTWYYYQ